MRTVASWSYPIPEGTAEYAFYPEDGGVFSMTMMSFVDGQGTVFDVSELPDMWWYPVED